jgi:hypothetical protein
MLKGYLYGELGHTEEIKAEKFIEQMADYFDAKEITEQDVREAVGDLIQEQYVIYGRIDQQIVATTPDHLTPENLDESMEGSK